MAGRQLPIQTMTCETHDICPLCGRELVPGPTINKHHLVPKSRGGREVYLIHKVCHSKLHAEFSERELDMVYNTFEALRDHPEIARFIRWVRRKPPEYVTRHRKARRRR